MISDLLNALDNVKQTGPDSWLASCPLHTDKHPSLAVTDRDGTVLIHCFSCQGSVHDIVAAVGLNITDLFPQTNSYEKQKRKYFPARDVLAAVAFDVQYVSICAGIMRRGKPIAKKDLQRLDAVQQRLEIACEYCN